MSLPLLTHYLLTVKSRSPRVIYMTKHKELIEGVGGSGQTIYIVAVVCDATGQWLHTDTFKRKSEALCWMKWA